MRHRTADIGGEPIDGQQHMIGNAERRQRRQPGRALRQLHDGAGAARCAHQAGAEHDDAARLAQPIDLRGRSLLVTPLKTCIFLNIKSHGLLRTQGWRSLPLQAFAEPT
ncbi:MAG: hypothetical protein BGO05_20845 [Rhizobiales bacterium 63-7]|nr:MAG: hypothetical protein BGO05_20845 [Rhizobiales bacterium 63-7]